jgi:hypothetical protein
MQLDLQFKDLFSLLDAEESGDESVLCVNMIKEQNPAAISGANKTSPAL